MAETARKNQRGKPSRKKQREGKGEEEKKSRKAVANVFPLHTNAINPILVTQAQSSHRRNYTNNLLVRSKKRGEREKEKK